MTPDLESWLQIWSHDSRWHSWLQIWSHDFRSEVMTSDLKSWLQIWSHDSRWQSWLQIWSHDFRSEVMTPDLESRLQIWSHDSRSEVMTPSGVMTPDDIHDSRSAVMTSDLKSWPQIWSHDSRSEVMTPDLQLLFFSLGIINSPFRSAGIKNTFSFNENSFRTWHLSQSIENQIVNRMRMVPSSETLKNPYKTCKKSLERPGWIFRSGKIGFNVWRPSGFNVDPCWITRKHAESTWNDDWLGSTRLRFGIDTEALLSLGPTPRFLGPPPPLRLCG